MFVLDDAPFLLSSIFIKNSIIVALAIVSFALLRKHKVAIIKFTLDEVAIKSDSFESTFTPFSIKYLDNITPL